MKKVENDSGEEIEDSELMIQGCVNGQEVPCEVDTRTQMCVIPERLAGGLKVFDRTACRPIDMAAMVKVRVKVGPVDTTVMATRVSDQYCTHPLVGRNVGLDNLMECLALAKAKLDGKTVVQHQVQTRAQERQQQAADLQGDDVRQAEQLDICEPEEAENSVTELDEPGVAVVEVEETVDPAVALDKVLDLGDAEVTVMSDTSVDGSVNLGLEIPLMKRGSSLNQEYSHSVMLDETLKRQWAESKKHGFCWVHGLLKRCVEDELRGNREVLVVPVSMRKRMMALVHDSLGHVGDGKMRWALQQSCCWPGISGDVKRYCRACEECQRKRKDKVAEVRMGEMPVHTGEWQSTLLVRFHDPMATSLFSHTSVWRANSRSHTSEASNGQGMR